MALAVQAAALRATHALTPFHAMGNLLKLIEQQHIRACDEVRVQWLRLGVGLLATWRSVARCRARALSQPASSQCPTAVHAVPTPRRMWVGAA